MGGIFGGGGSAATSESRIGSFKVMSQGFGVTIPAVLGTNRVNGVLIDYTDFYSIAHESSQGGKGGGGSSTSTYTYYATVLLLCCEGGGGGVNFGKLWVNKDVYATPDLKGFAEFDGADGQAAWAYMEGKHPDHALVYKGFAYLAAHDYELTNSASIGNHSVEVQGFYATEGAGGDASMANCITGLLLNSQWGADFGTARLLALTQLNNYCQSYSIVISPVLSEQKAAKDVLDQWLTIANCTAIWTENATADGGALQFLPYSEKSHTGNGYTYNPIAPLNIHLTDDDFIVDGDTDPVRCTRKLQSDATNSITVEFKARGNDYNKLTAKADDLAQIQQFGERPETFTADEITLMPVARVVAQNLLQRKAYNRNEYEFTLSLRYCYAEAGDVLYITEPLLGLDDVPVFLTKVSDSGDSLLITAEEITDGAGHSETYASDDAVDSRVIWNIPVGDINAPIIFHAPAVLSKGGYEVWVAVSNGNVNYGGCQVWVSFDDDNYSLAGTMNGQSICGVLAADFPTGTDPDTDISHALLVDLSQSSGGLKSVGQDDAETYRSLCLVGDEFVAYRDATLTSGNYNLTTPNPATLTGITATGTPTTTAITFAALTRASNYYNAGTLTCTAGVNAGTSRTITTYTNAAGVKTVNCSGFPSTPAAGDTFTIQALPYMRRGLYGTSKGAITGNHFVRCDNRLFKVPFTAKDIGSILRMKFLSFNQFGQAVQSISDVPAYSIVLSTPPQGASAVDTYYQWVNE